MAQHVGGEGRERRFGRLHNRGVETFEKGAGAVGEFAHLPARARPGEGGHGLDVGIGVVEEIERAAIGPEMPGEEVLPVQGDVIRQPGAESGEEILEHRAHGQHGRAGVDRTGGGGHCAHLAAGVTVALQHGDAQPCARETRGSGKPADPSTDDDGVGRAGVRNARPCHVRDC